MHANCLDIVSLARTKESAQRYQTHLFRGHFLSGNGGLGTRLASTDPNSQANVYKRGRYGTRFHAAAFRWPSRPDCERVIQFVACTRAE